MRVLLLVLFLVFTVNTFSQTNSAETNFKKGTEAARAERYEKAIEFYKISLEGVKKNKKLKSKIHYNIGSSLYQKKDFKNAEKSFSKAIKLSKDKYIQAIYALGLTQIELKKMGAAEASFRKVIRLEAKHGEAWFDLGMVLLGRKMYKNAEIAFRKSIENKSTRSAEAQNNLGVISAIGGYLELAKRQFQIAYFQSNRKLLVAKKNLEYWERYLGREFGNRLAINQTRWE